MPTDSFPYFLQVVSNLVSAHDANSSLTIDTYFNENNEEMNIDPNNPNGGKDSIWVRKLNWIIQVCLEFVASCSLLATNFCLLEFPRLEWRVDGEAGSSKGIWRVASNWFYTAGTKWRWVISHPGFAIFLKIILHIFPNSFCFCKGLFQCGPASLEAVRNGQVGFAYDVSFVLAEVNADYVKWREDKQSEFGFTRVNSDKYQCVNVNFDLTVHLLPIFLV